MKYNLLSGGNANTLAGDGALDSTASPSGKPDSFLYDPMDPVPTMGGNDTFSVIQRPEQSTKLRSEKRKGVLVYSTGVANGQKRLQSSER